MSLIDRAYFTLEEIDERVLQLDPIALFAANQQVDRTNADRFCRLKQIAIFSLRRIKAPDFHLALPEQAKHIPLD